MKSLIVRVETSAALGAGHAMRCLALAEEWRARGGRVVFVMSELPASFARRLQAQQLEFLAQRGPVGSGADAAATASLAGEIGAGWVVVDGPMFGAEWDAAFPSDLRLLRIDDEALRGQFRADAILNQNLGASDADYPRLATDCRRLLGPRFALLRREFQAARSATGLRGSRVLVTLGGTDPARATERVLAALGRPEAAEIEADFVVGPSNPRREELLQAIRPFAPRLRAVLAPDDLPERMATAPFAITAGGTTLYELALFGTPMLVIATAENQRRTAERFGEALAAQYVGWHSELPPEQLATQVAAFRRDLPRRTVLGEAASRLVDGRGASRVTEALLAALRTPHHVPA